MKKIYLIIIGIAIALTAYAVPLNQKDMGRLFDQGIKPDATYPVSIEQAKAQLKLEVSDTSENQLLQDYIESATDEAERYIDTDIVTHQYKLECTEWINNLKFAKQPVKAITKIEYVDSNGDTQTLASDKYELLPSEDNPKDMQVYYKDFSELPTVDTSIRAVTIYFETGMEKVPKGISQAIKLLLTNYYDNRGDIVERLPKASEKILRKYRKYA